jgi:hypothetical protein
MGWGMRWFHAACGVGRESLGIRLVQERVSPYTRELMRRAMRSTWQVTHLLEGVGQGIEDHLTRATRPRKSPPKTRPVVTIELASGSAVTVYCTLRKFERMYEAAIAQGIRLTIDHDDGNTYQVNPRDIWSVRPWGYAPRPTVAVRSPERDRSQALRYKRLGAARY